MDRNSEPPSIQNSISYTLGNFNEMRRLYVRYRR